jgi:hypothetical protein
VARPVRKAVQVIAAIAVVVGTTVVAWWAIGDQSTTGPRVASHPPPLFRFEEGAERPAALRGEWRADHLLEPWAISLGTERAIALAAAVAAGVGATVLVLARPTLDRAWWAVIAMVGAVGVGIAFTHRLLTAGVDGANIGAGLVIIFGGPVAVVLLVLAVVVARSTSRAGRVRPMARARVR